MGPAVLSWFTDPQIWASLVTLTVLEIVLGIDNLIFLSIAASRLPENRRALARRSVLGHAVSWRDMVLLAGGLFLIANGTREIHEAVEGEAERDERTDTPASGFAGVIVQIVVLDIVFSLDSVITAIGMTREFAVMASAIVIAIGVMVFAAGPVSGFIARHPTVKMLALSFLLLIGAALVADGLHVDIPKGYLYFAVAFSIAVEALNLAAGRRRRWRRAR